MVTDEMVEAAANAIAEKRGYAWPGTFDTEEIEIGRENMRAALEAALSAAEPVKPYGYVYESTVRYFDGRSPQRKVDFSYTKKNISDDDIEEFEISETAVYFAPPAPSVAVKAASANLDKIAEDRWSAYPWSVAGRRDGEIENVRQAYLVAFKAGFYAARSALSAQMQDVAGWQSTLPTYHRYPYVVESISGKWHLRIHHGNGASHTVSTHDTAEEAIAAAPAKQEGAHD